MMFMYQTCIACVCGGYNRSPGEGVNGRVCHSPSFFCSLCFVFDFRCLPASAQPKLTPPPYALHCRRRRQLRCQATLQCRRRRHCRRFQMSKLANGEFAAPPKWPPSPHLTLPLNRNKIKLTKQKTQSEKETKRKEQTEVGVPTALYMCLFVCEGKLKVKEESSSWRRHVKCGLRQKAKEEKNE